MHVAHLRLPEFPKNGRQGARDQAQLPAHGISGPELCLLLAASSPKIRNAVWERQSPRLLPYLATQPPVHPSQLSAWEGRHLQAVFLKIWPHLVWFPQDGSVPKHGPHAKLHGPHAKFAK